MRPRPSLRQSSSGSHPGGGAVGEAVDFGVIELAEVSRPVRTCIGCRQARPRSELLRIVQDSGQLIPDPLARRTGRGAWLHPECLDQAVGRKAFNRAFKFGGRFEISPLVEFLSHGGERR